MSKQRMSIELARDTSRLEEYIIAGIRKGERITAFQIILKGELYEAFVIYEQDGGAE